MDEFVFFFALKISKGKKKMKNVNYPKCRNVNSRFYSVLWCYGLRGLGGCIHHFRDLGYVNYRKYENVNYCLGFVLG